MADSNHEAELDLVIDFSLGMLSADQEKVLLAAARKNPELDAMLREQCANHERFRARKDQELAEPRLATVTAISDPTRAPMFRQPRTWFLGSLVAASLALILIFNTNSTGDQYWLPVHDMMALQRANSAVNNDMSAGVALYADGDLAGAIAALRQAEVQGAVLDLRNLYLASALLNEGREAEAEQVLATVDLPSLPHPWRGYGVELKRLLAEVE